MTELAVSALVWFVVGLAAGGGIALIALARFQPAAAPAIIVPPEALMRAINEGKIQIHSTPTVVVDWSVIHSAIAAHGYMLVARDGAAPPRPH